MEAKEVAAPMQKRSVRDIINWLLPRDSHSPIVTILGRALTIGGFLALVLPIFVPLSALGAYSELELRLTLFVSGALMVGTGVAVEKRLPFGYYLYVGGALLSMVAHLVQWCSYNLGLLLIDIGFLGLIMARRNEFTR